MILRIGLLQISVQIVRRPEEPVQDPRQSPERLLAESRLKGLQLTDGRPWLF